MNDLKNRLITILLKIIGLFSFGLSISGRQKLGALIGDFMRLFIKSRKNITQNNLKNAFPTLSEAEINSIVKKSYRNLGITLIEIIILGKLNPDDIKNYIKYENIDLLNKVYSRGKGLILLSGHYGNWELLAYSAGLFSGIPILIIVQPQKNKYADEIINKFRTQGGNRVVSMYEAAREIIKSLKNKEAVALLADQAAKSDKDIFIEFFGRLAATYEAPANLALRFDIPIVAGFAERTENGSYLVNLVEIEHQDLQYDAKGIEELTRRHVKLLESAIIRKPELWAWQHRRWKHTPPGGEIKN